MSILIWLVVIPLGIVLAVTTQLLIEWRRRQFWTVTIVFGDREFTLRARRRTRPDGTPFWVVCKDTYIDSFLLRKGTELSSGCNFSLGVPGFPLDMVAGVGKIVVDQKDDKHHSAARVQGGAEGVGSRPGEKAEGPNPLRWN
jgi:hypothetical protein